MKPTRLPYPFVVTAVFGLFASLRLLGQDQQPENKAQPSAAAPAHAAQQSGLTKSADLPQELVDVNSRLREACREFCPAAHVRYNNGDKQIIAEYRSRDFQVYSVFKDGSVAEQLHVERGPKHDGFLLQVTLQPGHYQGAAVILQDIRHPYWTTYLNAIESTDKEWHLHIRLSYGSRTDRELLGHLKEAIGITMPARSNKQPGE